MRLEDHPTVIHYRQNQKATNDVSEEKILESAWVKNVARQAGADDAGLIHIDNPDIADQRADILKLFPQTQTLVVFVNRLNPENIRCVSRAVSDYEYMRGFESLQAVAHKMTVTFRDNNIRALAPSGAFPMETDEWPGKMWSVSHKPLAIAVGLGQFGLNRLIIHPRFGNFIVLNTVLIDKKADAYDTPLDFNPCIDCKLCVSVCPTGAISADGHFNFANCMTHNYRDRMGGFIQWVEKIAASKNARQYRKKVSDPETVSMWQSLSYSICNKSSYCMAVCPAGEEMIPAFLEDRKGYVKGIVKPLKEKTEPVYVVPGSDAEEHAAKIFPHKQLRRTSNGLRPKSAQHFLQALPLIFQREKSKGLNATYHFTFNGDEQLEGTVVIKDKAIAVTKGHAGKADIAVTADSKTWVGFLAKEKNMLFAMATGKIRIKGSPLLMQKFARCFPS